MPINYFFLSISLIFGPELEVVISLSSTPETGGLVASGDGTAAGNPNETDGPRLKPRLGRFGVDGGGLPADPGTGGTGATPLLNSAHRGHFLFVFMCPIWPQ
jgi:hypothetical protein